MNNFKTITNGSTKHKLIADYEDLEKLIQGLRVAGYKVIVTIGTWDLLHIGHVRYLMKAKSKGDILLVGVDTDKTVKKYKGELRPIVPFEERCEMLAYQSCVDLVTGVDDVDKKGNWKYSLIKKIKPDVFIAVKDSYSKSQLNEIEKYSGKLIILPRQALRTSTTKMIQNTVKKHLDKMYGLVDSKK